ncbi:ankyrin repeat-containing domain protein [Podospora australis]|uniref:Ankyrin repeat-containing domain protein n=1 Tax=Podospora australis TaxID=1536484 RepID=A0AAN6WJ17_9PEZI|nr:ankyrin repeat-containing domain protein [Podospora australis]
MYEFREPFDTEGPGARMSSSFPQYYTSVDEILWDFFLASLPIVIFLLIRPSPGAFAAGLTISYWFTSIFTSQTLFGYYIATAVFWWARRDFRVYSGLSLEATPPSYSSWVKARLLLTLANVDVLAPPKIPHGFTPLRGRLYRLTPRQGDRPTVKPIAPFRQIDQKGAPDVFYRLNALLRGYQARQEANGLQIKISLLEYGIRALFWDIGRHRTAGTLNAAEEWGGEIAHVHAADGSIHVNLHPEDVHTVLESGWGERHPLCANDKKFFRFLFHGVFEKRLPVPDGWTLIYAPRTEAEKNVASEIVMAAIWHSTGGAVYPPTFNPELMDTRWDLRPEDLRRRDTWWYWFWRMIPTPPDPRWRCECCQRCRRGGCTGATPGGRTTGAAEPEREGATARPEGEPAPVRPEEGGPAGRAEGGAVTGGAEERPRIVTRMFTAGTGDDSPAPGRDVADMGSDGGRRPSVAPSGSGRRSNRRRSGGRNEDDASVPPISTATSTMSSQEREGGSEQSVRFRVRRSYTSLSEPGTAEHPGRGRMYPITGSGRRHPALRRLRSDVGTGDVLPPDRLDRHTALSWRHQVWEMSSDLLAARERSCAEMPSETSCLGSVSPPGSAKSSDSLLPIEPTSGLSDCNIIRHIGKVESTLSKAVGLAKDSFKGGGQHNISGTTGEHRYPRPDQRKRHVRIYHMDKSPDEPSLLEVLSQRPDGPNHGRARISSRNYPSMAVPVSEDPSMLRSNWAFIITSVYTIAFNVSMELDLDPDPVREWLEVNGYSAEDRADENICRILHHATSLGYLDVVEVLLEHHSGADVILRRGKTGSTALHQAAKHGHLSVLKYFLETAGAVGNVEAVDGDGGTVLAVAVWNGRAKVVEYLLKTAHAAVNVRDSNGLTPLHFACWVGTTQNHSVETVELLIEAGADIEDRAPEDGSTAIFFAAKADMGEIIRILVDKHGSNLPARDRNDKTPLYVAAESDCRDAARELLRGHVGDTSILDARCGPDRMTPLAVAVSKNFEGMVRVLLDHDADPSIPNKDGHTPMDIALDLNHRAIIELLVNRGVCAATRISPPLSSDTELLTALKHLETFLERLNTGDSGPDNSSRAFAIAAENGCLREMKRWLAKSSVDINFDGTTTIRDQSPLSRAAVNGHDEVVAFLLEKGADVSLPDNAGKTALWWACWRGHDKIVSLLLDCGNAKVDCPELSGMMPLSAAAQKGHDKIITLLLDYGAEPTDVADHSDDNKVECSNNTSASLPRLADEQQEVHCSATSISESSELSGIVSDSYTDKDLIVGDYEADMMHAAAWGILPAAKRLIQMGVDVNSVARSHGLTPLMVAAESSHLDLMDLFMCKGADLELRSDDGRTVIWHAAAKGEVEALRFLIQKGSEIEALCGDLQSTPLSIAAENGHHGVVELLLDAGATVDSTNLERQTPLHLSVYEGHELVVRLLLAKGANVERAGENEHTPLMVAAHRGHAAIVRVLLANGADHSASAEGWSAFSLAAFDGHEAIVKLLLNSGADLNHSLNRGESTLGHFKTPLWLAAGRGHAMVVKILLENGALQHDVDGKQLDAVLTKVHEKDRDAVMRLLSQASLESTNANCFSLSARYQYRPLPERSFIRVLELQPAYSEDDIISFNLVQVDLRRQPRYQALSYEWGERSGLIPVLCDGRIVLITPNLKAALKHIRFQQDRVVTLWVDAVCIHQGRYRGAKPAVFAEVFDVLARNPRWRWPSATNPGSAASPEAESLLASIADEDIRHGSPVLTELFHRTYFNRAWILQEMVLAQGGIVMFGPARCDWSSFIHALWVLNWSYSALRMFDSDDAFGPLFSRFHATLYEATSFESVLEVMYRHNVKPEPSPLEDGVNALVAFKAGDPRDKVYGALGLAADADRNPIKTITPDYGLNTREVYIMAARYFVKTSQNMDFWDNRNRPRDKSLSGLPTWVPDWSCVAPSEITTHFVVQPEEWEHARDLIKGNELTTTDKSLYLDGYILDKVVFALPLTPSKDVYDDVVRPVVHFLTTTRATSIFAKYPDFGSGATIQKRDVSLETQEPLTNLEALRNIMIDNDEDGFCLEAVSYLAWRISRSGDLSDNDGNLTANHPPASQRIPQGIAEALNVEQWDLNVESQGINFDHKLLTGMEKCLQYGADILITERGYFAMTGPNIAQPGMVVAVLAGAYAFGLLIEKQDEDTGTKYYEYQDEVFFRERFHSLDDVAKGALVEPLEIR